MNFLQRLASQAIGETAGDGAAVRAALPSRFATRTASPWPTEEAPSSEYVTMPTARQAASTDLPVTRRDTEQDHEAARPSAWPLPSLAQRVQGATDDATQPQPNPRSALPDTARRRSTEPPSEVTSPVPRTVAALMAALLSPGERGANPAVARTTGHAVASPRDGPLPVANAMPAPLLSDTTLHAARRQSEDAHLTRPPVIHVTIDRIDIRAPAAPVRPPSPTRTPRHAAPTQSLADYLRGRPRGAGGAS